MELLYLWFYSFLLEVKNVVNFFCYKLGCYICLGNYCIIVIVIGKSFSILFVRS